MSANPIKKIEVIKNVRSFLDFSCTDDFDKKNVIYAPNGVGKTNLSRFLEYISDKDLNLQSLKSLEAGVHPIEFKVIFNDQTSVDQNNYKSTNLERVLVYNSDYVEKNVRSSDFSNKQIDGQLEVELGSEQVKLAELENQLATKTAELDTEKTGLESLITTKINEIKEWDSRGRLITAEIIYPNLNDQKYSDCLSNKDDRTIDGSIQEGWINAKENFDQIKDLDPETDKLVFAFNELRTDRIDLVWIEENLTKKPEFSEPPTGEIKEYIEKLTNDWIKAGLELHKEDGDHCPFCLQALSEDGKGVIDKYRVHIESEKAKFEEKIDSEIENIKDFVAELVRIDNSLKTVFETRTKNLNLSQTWTDISTTSAVSRLNTIKSKLAHKRKSPDSEMFLGEESGSREECIKNTADYFAVLKTEIQTVNAGIVSNKAGVVQINHQLESIGNRQTNLRKLLGQKYLVEFFDSNRSAIEKRNDIAASIKSIENEIAETKRTMPTKEMSSKIVDLFNIFINQIGIKKYKAGIQAGKIVLKLDDTHDISSEARNLLSEGEKNAIALSYFLASAIRRLPSSEKYSAGIFVIDDPVCSVGYKYFYGICDVLKTFHKTIQIKALTGNESSECPQLIILTHNIQFYNMLTSNIFKNDAKNGKAIFFELESSGNRHFLKKVAAVKLSEYKTALRRVKRYSEGICIEENVGNDIRRVLETICNFHGYIELNQDNITSVLPTMAGSLLSFAHDSSHEDTNNYEDPFDATQYKEMATELIRLVEVYSPEMLKDLN